MTHDGKFKRKTQNFGTTFGPEGKMFFGVKCFEPLFILIQSTTFLKTLFKHSYPNIYVSFVVVDMQSKLCLVLFLSVHTYLYHENLLSSREKGMLIKVLVKINSFHMCEIFKFQLD